MSQTFLKLCLGGGGGAPHSRLRKSRMATSRIVWCCGILTGPEQVEYPDVHMGINGTLSKKKK